MYTPVFDPSSGSDKTRLTLLNPVGVNVTPIYIAFAVTCIDLPMQEVPAIMLL